MSYKNLYQERLQDHYKYPRNKGNLENPDFSSGVLNPSCGDEVIMQGMIKEGKIAQIAFEGKGCVISLAAASLLTEKVLGQDIKKIQAYDKQLMLDLVQLELGPTRLRCALLALEALHKGLEDL